MVQAGQPGVGVKIGQVDRHVTIVSSGGKLILHQVNPQGAKRSVRRDPPLQLKATAAAATAAPSAKQVLWELGDHP